MRNRRDDAAGDGGRERAAAKFKRLSEIPRKDINWLWHPYLPGGSMGLLSAPGDRGKGLVATSIAAALTTGGYWPASHERAPTGSVLWCEAEDPIPEVVRPRMEAAGADLDRVLITEPGDFATTDIADVVRDEDVKLVVFSPLVTFMKMLKDANKELDVRRSLEKLNAQIAGTDAFILGITHVNKSEEKTAMLRVMGSVAFRNFGRTVLMCDEEDAETRTYRLIHEKHNWSERAPDLIYQPQMVGNHLQQDLRLVWSKADENVDTVTFLQQSKGEKRESAGTWLFNYLSDNGPTHRKSVLTWATAFGYSEDAITKAFERSQVLTHEPAGRETIWRVREDVSVCRSVGVSPK